MNNSAAPVREIIFAHAVMYWLTVTVLLTEVIQVILLHAPYIADGLTQLHCLYLMTLLESRVREKLVLFFTYYTASMPAAARLLRLWFRIPPRAWMSVYCEYCAL